jgi:phosphoglycolate phosphatase-like HAD superfamily hydrolase
MTIQEGGPELVAFLARNGVKRAVLTRNYEKNAFLMQHKFQRDMNDATFDLIIGKDSYFDGSYQPVQEIPKAQRIHQICTIWGCHPSEVIMVGDSITDDIVEGNRAGCGGTVLLQPKGYELNNFYGTTIGNSLERKPTLCVESLTDLMQYLEAQLNYSVFYDYYGK